jgi:hypothetical protein
LADRFTKATAAARGKAAIKLAGGASALLKRRASAKA